MSFFQELIDMATGSNVAERQNRQWQDANTQLAEARDIMAEFDRRAQSTELADMPHGDLVGEAVARCLYGLLAERLSTT